MPLHPPMTMLALATMAGAAAATVPCTGALPDALAVATALGSSTLATDAGSGRFRLIAGQCPGLADFNPPRAAEQLRLFDRATTVAFTLTGAPGTGPRPTVVALPEPRPPVALGAVGERIVALAPGVLDAARTHGLDPLLLHAIAHVESRHNPQAVSPAGARGLMQVMPATAQRFGVAEPERSLHDAATNLRASAALLRSLQQRYGADLRLVLAAYNAGEGAVARHRQDVPPYPETQAYVRDVSAIYRRLKAEFAVTASGALLALKRED